MVADLFAAVKDGRAVQDTAVSHERRDKKKRAARDEDKKAEMKQGKLELEKKAPDFVMDDPFVCENGTPVKGRFLRCVLRIFLTSTFLKHS